MTEKLYNIHAALGFSTDNLSSTKDVSHFIHSFLKKKKLRSGLSQTQKKLVDGIGAKNIVAAMMVEN